MTETSTTANFHYSPGYLRSAGDAEALAQILVDYGTPDPSLVSKLVKNYKDKSGQWRTMELDYVGHADITKALISIDPTWTWAPLAFENGLPRIIQRGQMLELWGTVTVCGKTLIGVGTCATDKNDASKELIGDLLRNVCMRFGIALSLWSKAEWDDHTPAPKPARTGAETPAVDDMENDPIGWATQAMNDAESVVALDAIANLVKIRLSEQERAQLRPLYLERKAALS